MAPRPPNYRQARGERTRAKELKKQEKLRRRDEETAKRKEGQEDPAGIQAPAENVGRPV